MIWLYVIAALCALFIAGQTAWLSRRNRKRTAEPMPDSDWRRELPSNWQTPATRHLGKTCIGIDDEERAA